MLTSLLHYLVVSITHRASHYIEEQKEKGKKKKRYSISEGYEDTCAIQ